MYNIWLIYMYKFNIKHINKYTFSVYIIIYHIILYIDCASTLIHRDQIGPWNLWILSNASFEQIWNTDKNHSGFLVNITNLLSKK